MPRNIGAGIHPGLDNDPNWYRKAVFYEVLVRAFADSNGSGSGDFTGLIGKLDYIQSLGVDCLWLPPFYASPLRDGGYDIADYCAVLPEFGTMPDFQEFVAQAHARGLRVITDLVINHTSDAHPWFQSSRNDPEGRTATSTSGATPTSCTRTPESSSSTPSPATGRSTRCAGSTSGTASSATSRT